MPRRLLATACILVALTGCQSGTRPPPPTGSQEADAIINIVRDAMKEGHLKSVIVRVTRGEEEILTHAAGETMTGVPATTDMHFRNGAVAISYVATLLLRLAEEKKVSLDDTLSRWLPEVPHAEQVTLGQLAQMTSGYHDYVLGNADFEEAMYSDPFRAWTTQELLDFAVTRPLIYEPGTNWNYAHTNYVLLGLALENATGEPVTKLLSEKVIRPLGLTNTVASLTAEIPSPVLHAFSSERRAFFDVPDGAPFYEETTYWNPSWTMTHGAIQTSNIYDLEATAAGVGSGRMLTEESYQRMISAELRGRTRAQPGCPTCFAQTDFYTYGLGIVISGDWLLQNPMFAGYAALAAYLPPGKVAIAVAVTFEPAAFDAEGNYHNEADTLFRRIATELEPDHAPPPRPAR